MEKNSTTEIAINLNIRTIQALRICLAIVESDYDVYFPSEFRYIFNYLQGYFDFEAYFGLNEKKIFSDVSFDHSKPKCKIGEISRPLIFPRFIFHYCKNK